MNALSALIAARQQELDMTWDDLASRGGLASGSLLEAFAKKEYTRLLRPELLHRIAVAIDVPDRDVHSAALNACGTIVHDLQADADAVGVDRIVVATVGPELSVADRQKVLEYSEAFARETGTA